MDVVKQAVETIKRMYNLSLLKLLERLPVSNGGTGAAAPEQARENLGIQFPLPVENGGTGADNAAAARGNLGIAFPLPVSSGGTGAGTAAAALANLGLPVASGTWTPQLISSDGGMTYTTSYNYSYYYRIGKLVYITFYMKVNVTAAGSGYARVQGLPFAPMSSGRYGLARMQFARTTSDTVGGAVAHVDSSLGMIRLQSESGLAALTWKEGDTWIGFAGCYIMDE